MIILIKFHISKYNVFILISESVVNSLEYLLRFVLYSFLTSHRVKIKLALPVMSLLFKKKKFLEKILVESSI